MEFLTMVESVSEEHSLSMITKLLSIWALMTYPLEEMLMNI